MRAVSTARRRHRLLLAGLGLSIVLLIGFSHYSVEKGWFGRANMGTFNTLDLFISIASAILVGVTAWHLIRRKVSVFPGDIRAGEEVVSELTNMAARLRQHAYWFINLRWLASTIALSLIFFSSHITGILPEKTFVPLILLVAVLVFTNVLFTFWTRHTRDPYYCIIIQVISDLVILTGLIHFSGGLENPLFIIYSFHVIISGILLTKRAAYALALVACGLLGFMSLGEYFRLIDHYAILFFPHEHGALYHAAYNTYYVLGRFLPFTAVLLCVAYFTTLVMDYLRGNEKNLEEMARAAWAERQKLETSVNAMGAGMLLLDRDLKVLWFNKRYQELFNRGDQMLGKICKLQEGENDDDSCADCISARAIEKGVTFEIEKKIVSPDHESRFYHVTSSPIRSENGEIAQVVELIQDITTRKAMEFEMLHTGKMAVLGRMAAGIAHEIGNPLSSLSTRIRLMETRKEEKFIKESLQILQEQIGRIKRIIHGISQFARPQHEDWTECRINQIVEETVDVIRLDRRAKGIAIEMSLVQSVLTTTGPRDKFFQVFINIGLNALEAMQGSGLLQINTLMSGGDIIVAFKDTGAGFSDEARANLFNPFYTTKQKGLGLGLFICYSIINSYGGTLEMESEKGKGTTFTIKLPIRRRQPDVEPLSRILR